MAWKRGAARPGAVLRQQEQLSVGIGLLWRP
jgi:hypothetical protein